MGFWEKLKEIAGEFKQAVEDGNGPRATFERGGRFDAVVSQQNPNGIVKISGIRIGERGNPPIIPINALDIDCGRGTVRTITMNFVPTTPTGHEQSVMRYDFTAPISAFGGGIETFGDIIMAAQQSGGQPEKPAEENTSKKGPRLLS